MCDSTQLSQYKKFDWIDCGVVSPPARSQGRNAYRCLINYLQPNWSRQLECRHRPTFRRCNVAVHSSDRKRTECSWTAYDPEIIQAAERQHECRYAYSRPVEIIEAWSFEPDERDWGRSEAPGRCAEFNAQADMFEDRSFSWRETCPKSIPNTPLRFCLNHQRIGLERPAVGPGERATNHSIGKSALHHPPLPIVSTKEYDDEFEWVTASPVRHKIHRSNSLRH